MGSCLNLELGGILSGCSQRATNKHNLGKISFFLRMRFTEWTSRDSVTVDA